MQRDSIALDDNLIHKLLTRPEFRQAFPQVAAAGTPPKATCCDRPAKTRELYNAARKAVAGLGADAAAQLKKMLKTERLRVFWADDLGTIRRAEL
jgi:hypothetical protein